MSTAVVELRSEGARFKRSAEFADQLWKKYPRPEDWPGVLDLYEAAAYRRVEYKTIWRACRPDRDGKAKLTHQRFGAAYRITKATLDRFGLVPERKVA